jgi:hypothetical protein
MPRRGPLMQFRLALCSSPTSLGVNSVYHASHLALVTAAAWPILSRSAHGRHFLSAFSLSAHFDSHDIAEAFTFRPCDSRLYL